MTGRRGALTLLTGSSAVQAGSGAASAVLATVLLGPAERGAMVLGLTIGGIAAVVAGLGTGSALRARLPAVTGEVGRRGLVAAYTWWSLAAPLLGAALAVVACRAGAGPVDPGLAAPGFLVAVAAVTAVQTALAQQTDAWFAVGRFRSGGGYAAAAALAGLVGLVAAAGLGRGEAGLLLGQALLSGAVVALAQARLRVAGLATLRPPAGADLVRADLVALMRQGVPVLGTTLGFVVAMRADRFVLGVFAGTAAVGVYSLAATLSEVPRMLPGAVGQLLLRDVARSARRAGVEAPRRDFEGTRGGLEAPGTDFEGAPGRPGAASAVRALRLATGLAVAAGVVIGLAGWLLVVPVFGAAFAPARPALLVLLLAEVALVPYGLAARGLVGGGWTRLAGGIGLAGAGVGLVLFALLVPLWTVMGAAVASLLLYAGLSAGSWRSLVRRLRRTPGVVESVPTVPAGAA